MMDEIKAREFAAWIKRRFGPEPDWDWCRRNYPLLVEHYGKPAPLLMPVPTPPPLPYNRNDELED